MGRSKPHTLITVYRVHLQLWKKSTTENFCPHRQRCSGALVFQRDRSQSQHHAECLLAHAVYVSMQTIASNISQERVGNQARMYISKQFLRSLPSCPLLSFFLLKVEFPDALQGQVIYSSSHHRALFHLGVSRKPLSFISHDFSER